MVLKNLIALTALCILTLGSTAFVNPENVEPLVETKASFPKFLSHFKKVELPFKLELADLPKYEAMKINTKKFSKKKGSSNTAAQGIPLAELQEFVYEQELMMSRMGPPKIMPIARFYPNEKMVAVIYGTYNSFRSDRAMDYKMVLYDLKGNVIKNQENKDFEYYAAFHLAQVSAGKTEIFEIDANNQVWKKTYKNIFEKDFKKFGFYDNDIIGYELEDTKIFKINTRGLVEPMKEYPVADRAALD